MIGFLARKFGVSMDLLAVTVAISTLTEADIDQMLALMQVYYAKIDREEFLQDLHAKDEVIVLREASGSQIVGFSTLKYYHFGADFADAVGIFSGDTIVDQKYWGRTTLQNAFLLNLCKTKLRYPKRKLYWFLISKGYKTYLLMANNFPVHYPQLEVATPPDMKELMKAVYGSLYPDTYDSERDLLQNAGHSYHLKQGVAAPTPEMVAQLSRVKFFVEKNPGWSSGNELTCIAAMDLSVVTGYLSKRVRKSLRRFRESRKNVFVAMQSGNN